MPIRFTGATGPRRMLAPVVSLLVATACGQPMPPREAAFAAPPVRGTVFAQVGDAAVTDAQLVAYEGLAVSGAAAGNLTYPQLLGKVEDRVRFELLAQAAADRGLAAEPEVVEAARKTMVRKLLADDMGPARLGASLAEDVLRDYYARHSADYLQPPMCRYTILRFGNDAFGRTQADVFARTWHRVGDDARALAAALALRAPGASGEATAAGKGAHRRRKVRAALHWQEEPFQDRPTVARVYGDDVAAAVFADAPQGTSSAVATAVVPSQRGPIAVRVLACRKGMSRSFEQARGDIVEQLVRRERGQLFQRYLDDLRRSYPIAIYEDRVRDWLAHPPAAPSQRAETADDEASASLPALPALPPGNVPTPSDVAPLPASAPAPAPPVGAPAAPDGATKDLP